MTDEQPIGLLVQPQPPLGRVAVAIMQGPLMQAAVTFDAADQLDSVISQLVGARIAVFGSEATPREAAIKTWRCKLGDDCSCDIFLRPEKCENYQGEHDE